MLKKTIFLTIILLNSSIIQLFSLDFRIDKVNEFSHANVFEVANISKKMQIDYPYLYTLTEYGLEIYVIGTTSELALISRTAIVRGWTIEKLNDSVYVGTRKGAFDQYDVGIYRFNVSDPYNPTIIQSLTSENWRMVISILGVEDLLVVSVRTATNTLHSHLIDPDLQYINQNVLGNLPLLVFNSNYFLTGGGNLNYQIYVLNDADGFTLAGSGNIAEAHDYGITYYHSYGDSILMFSNQRSISLWDISDINNWQLLSIIEISDLGMDFTIGTFGAFHIIDDYLLYLGSLNFVVIDLSDNSAVHLIENPTFIYSGGLDYTSWEENIYITTGYSGVHWYSFADFPVFMGKYGKDNINAFVEANGDYIFVNSGWGSKDGLVIHDISNPEQIEEVHRFNPGDSQMFLLYGSQVVQHVLTDFGLFHVYDFTDPVLPVLTNSLDVNPWIVNDSVDFPYPYIDEFEPEMIYFLIPNNGVLLKFDISDSDTAELCFQAVLTVGETGWGKAVIHNGILYRVIRVSNRYDLHIYDGLQDNVPVHVNTISNVGVNNSYPFVSITGSYLAIYGGQGSIVSQSCYLYSLTDPLLPELTAQINISGRPYIQDDLLFHNYGRTVFVFDMSGDVSGIINPSAQFFLNNGLAYWMFFQEREGRKYAYCASYSCINVYEYTYTVSTDDVVVEIPAVTSLFQNYPNPFNPETKIAFYLEKGGEVKLEIFNIRGQRLAVLIDGELPQGEHSLIWNPITATGKELPSGVYFYRLQTGDYERTRKMLYLK